MGAGRFPAWHKVCVNECQFIMLSEIRQVITGQPVQPVSGECPGENPQKVNSERGAVRADSGVRMGQREPRINLG